MLTSKQMASKTSQSLREQLKSKGRRRRATFSSGGAPAEPRNDLLPQLEFVTVPIEHVNLPARNVRKIIEAHVEEVLRSIRRYGYCAPLMIGENNVLLDGAIRFEAAKRAGLHALPCIRVGHLASSEQRQLRLALNRLAEKGEWNLDDLKVEFSELIQLDEPLVTGFDPDEIDFVLLSEDRVAAERGPIEPLAGACAVARPGDLFRLGSHRLVCGDATDPTVIKQVMGDARDARLVLTDEPYNVKIKGHVTGGSHREFMMASGELSDEEFLAFNTAWISAVLPALCDGGILGTFIDWRGLSAVQVAASALSLTPLNLVVWSKTNAGMGSLYRSQHELLPLFRKGDSAIVNNVALGRKGRWRSNVWVYPGASSLGSDARKGLKDHPTVKPTAMLQDAFLDLTNRGDTVLDPFLGSGSTLIAADATGRVCRGVEIDPLYVDVIIRRYQSATGTAAVLAGSSHTFDQLTEERSNREAPQAMEAGSDIELEESHVEVEDDDTRCMTNSMC